jgi:nicotinamide-nucleotide amidase
MARGIRATSGADYGIAITGIAGPGGGSAEKPAGTVHIAVVHPEGEWEQKFYFPFDRLRFKQLTAAAALDRLRRILLSLSQ